MDHTIQEFEEEEIRPLLIVADLPERQEICDVLNTAFKYLEARITSIGLSNHSYDCSHMYEV